MNRLSSWLSGILRPSPTRIASPSVTSPQPVHPPLIGNFVNGFLVYCGLVSAGLIALIASDRFEAMADIGRWITFAAVGGAFAGGALSLVGFAFAINYARYAELGEPASKLNRARKLSLGLTNGAIYIIIGATAAAGIALFLYLQMPLQTIAPPPPIVRPVIVQPVECRPQIIEVCGHVIDK